MRRCTASRSRQSGCSGATKAMPWILDGEPRGFPRDLVRWNATADLPALLKPRIAAMFDITAALDDNRGPRTCSRSATGILCVY